MASVLIGNTGFVGSNVAAKGSFDAFFHSTNIENLAGGRYDLIVCCGAPGVKWLANKEPENDLRSIQRLIEALNRVEAKTVVLISTVDVYPSPLGVDESTPIKPEDVQPYGRNRLLLEQFITERFSDSYIMRLTGLFGPNLKKNAIYDLLHNNQIEKIDHRAVFQFYNVERLWDDIHRVIDSGLHLVNWATEPIRVDEMAKTSFGLDFRNETGGVPPKYDMRSLHSDRFGKTGPYIYSKSEVLEDLLQYVKTFRGVQS